MTSDAASVREERPDYPIREIFQKFFRVFSEKYHVTAEQRKTASCIEACKTGKLGYTAEECPGCGFVRIHARSCNNRNCPNCQAPMEKKWVLERESELIPGFAYYHVIFTLPHELNPLILENQKLLYGLLFSAASDTLVTLCRDKKYMGAVPGIVSVLHTWGQKLNFHPHLHVMLSGGGISPGNHLSEARHKGFIIPVKVLGKLFRGKFMDQLKAFQESGKLRFTGTAAAFSGEEQWQALVNTLYSKDWLPFLKETFNGNGNAVKYLARYAYRTAISNARIVRIGPDTVTFGYTDYADRRTKKERTVSGTEFIRLFFQHVLPAGVHRVRFSGFLANCRKKKALTLIGELTSRPYSGNPVKGKGMAELLRLLYGSDICTCPVCRSKLRTMFFPRAPALS